MPTSELELPKAATSEGCSSEKMHKPSKPPWERWWKMQKKQEDMVVYDVLFPDTKKNNSNRNIRTCGCCSSQNKEVQRQASTWWCLKKSPHNSSWVLLSLFFWTLFGKDYLNRLPFLERLSATKSNQSEPFLTAKRRSLAGESTTHVA